jgi:ABC transporter substrate binding protein
MNTATPDLRARRSEFRAYAVAVLMMIAGLLLMAAVAAFPPKKERRYAFDAVVLVQVVTLLGGAAAAWPLAARAQQSVSKMPRVGIIDPAAQWDHFRQGLRDLGYIEGRDIAIEYRSAEVRPERLVAAATELAQLPVDVIVTFGSPATQAAKQATTTIPIVMSGIGDPVRAGFVASLAHPGGNITGLA